MATEPKTDAERTVANFLHSMGPTWEEFLQGYERWLTEDALWTNTGFPDCKGREECIKMLHRLRGLTGMEYCTIEIHNMASRGDVVLTERTDWMHREDGSVIAEFAIMGAFEVRGDQVARYSDHFADSEIKNLAPNLRA